ncbi:MAG TPA: lipopolysaccharide kinase InaA family protein [Nitrososphaera sp.]|nr:lipopolysaccharide kinase InaA family protein [Nitrososphaera sp.]
MRILCSWNNGQKAVVHLVECSNGEKQIQKLYKPGFAGWMFREYFSIWYVSRWLDIVPKLISFRPWKKELVMSYIPGQRVLEWVLEHFGQPNLDLHEFRNFEAMGRDPRITEAFVRFRESSSVDALGLKTAIKQSYARLHSIGWQHGTSDPRNVLYDGRQAYIIDFDHARPSLSPAKNDYPDLTHWFGIAPDYPQNANKVRTEYEHEPQ